MSTASSYIDQLPRGLESYPQCEARLDAFREFLDQVPRSAWDERFAVAIEPHLSKGAKAWVPEVLCSTIIMMTRDQLDDEASLTAAVYDANVRLFRSPLFRGLMLVMSTTLVVMGAAKRWSAFHRGSELEITEWERSSHHNVAHVELRHPPGLFLGIHHRVFGEALRAAAVLNRARSVDVELMTYDSRAQYRVAYVR